jgi:hypothetical protein
MKITTFDRFRKSLKREIVSQKDGTDKTTLMLSYGIDGDFPMPDTSEEEAYEHYKRNAALYDYFIPAESFLLHD